MASLHPPLFQTFSQMKGIEIKWDEMNVANVLFEKDLQNNETRPINFSILCNASYI